MSALPMQLIRPDGTALIRCTVWLGLVLIIPFGGLDYDLAKVPKLSHAPRGFPCAQPRSGDDVHELDAINNESFKGRHVLKLPAGIGELLREFGTSLEFCKRNLQTKLPKMFALLNSGSTGSYGRHDPSTDDDSEERERTRQNANDNRDVHIVAGTIIGGLSGLLIGSVGLLIWCKRFMPNVKS